MTYVAADVQTASGVIAFTTANEVARETGWAMHDWGHGDRLTNEAFAPLETYAERFGALLARARALGFDAIDLWGAHLSPEWATDEHVAIAQEALAAHDAVERSAAAGGHTVDVRSDSPRPEPMEWAR